VKTSVSMKRHLRGDKDRRSLMGKPLPAFISQGIPLD